MGHPWYNECLMRISQERSCRPYCQFFFSSESYHIDVYGSARSADCSASPYLYQYDSITTEVAG